MTPNGPPCLPPKANKNVELLTIMTELGELRWEWTGPLTLTSRITEGMGSRHQLTLQGEEVTLLVEFGGRCGEIKPDLVDLALLVAAAVASANPDGGADG